MLDLNLTDEITVGATPDVFARSTTRRTTSQRRSVAL